MRNLKSLQVNDVDALLKIKDKEGSGAVILAGGTNVSNYIKQGKIKEGTLVDISRIDALKKISERDGVLEIGSCVTISDILDSGIAKKRVPFFVDSLKQFANPLIRNLATIGGNIADASPVADTAPLLLVLNAAVVAAKKDETRKIPIDEFFNQPRLTNLDPHEVITGFLVPFQNKGTGVFLKMGERNSSAISVVSVAVFIQRNGSVIEDIRIAAGGVAPKPIRGKKTEALFTGQSVAAKDIRRISRTIKDEIDPISDIRGSAAWRKELTANLVARGIRRCLGMEE